MMGTLLSGTCWPVHYPTKWTALFALALCAGTLLGVQARLRVRPKAPNQVQAGIRVYAKYEGETAYQLANADIYFGREPADMRANQVIRVHASEPAVRTQAEGVPIDFMVQLLDTAGKEEGRPVHLEMKWPSQTMAEAPLRVERPYTRPRR